MSLVKWAIFGLLMLPFAEIAVFVAVALKIGFLAALALTILTSLAGMAVIRNAGRSEIARVRGAFGDGVITRVELDGPGFLTVLGGFLLVLPGFLTDIARRAAAAAGHPSAGFVRRCVAPWRAPNGQPAARRSSISSPDQWRRVPEERIEPAGQSAGPD